MAKRNRSTLCSCGSGKKYKKCCLVKSYPRFTKGSAVAVTSNKGENKKQVKIWDRQNWQ